LLQILGNKGKKTEVLNSITFQLNKAQSVMPYQQMGMINPNLMNEINALRSEIAALKMQQEIEEDDEDEEPEEENFLAGLMKSPQVQTMILSQLSSLFAPTQKVTHVAGIEKTETMANETEIDNEERIYDAVERLKLVDDQLASDLELLCEMAETDKMQFNFLLKMLRK
jgi:mannitol/fructose-specific phosphotransferase system IIA component (Ntr-type)